jgi:uncharacterized protein YigA (DUF484 family)
MSKVDSSTIITKDESIDAASVAGYLRQHPDFFNEHSALLADIKLTHDCGPATSLIERQTQVMRHKILDYAARMSDILTTARRNDVQFEKTKRLVLELITATHLNALTGALKESFTGEFHADAVHLALFSSLKTADNHPNLSSAKSLDESANFAETQKLANKNWAYFQAFKGPAMVHLFPDHNKLQSSAVVPLYLADKALGVLIIASNNANHYNDQLDTLFLNHVAAVISRCLGRIQA